MAQRSGAVEAANGFKVQGHHEPKPCSVSRLDLMQAIVEAVFVS